MFCCPTSIIVDHRIVNGIAPIDTTITYEVVKYDDKCWITQNLGATRHANTIDEIKTAKEVAGWHWQFGYKQGFKYDSSDTPKLTPNDNWINEIVDDGNWRIDNDPCLELGNDWCIPTFTDWKNANSGWTTGPLAFASALKLYYAGNLKTSGEIDSRNTHGLWWSSTQDTDVTKGINIVMYETVYVESNNLKEKGYSIRCVKKP